LARPGSPAETVCLQELVDRDEVAFGLRHLAAFDLQEAVMHPVTRHRRRAVSAARLGNLVLMMRKDEVQAAAMNVENLAEIRRRHGRALDVPAGPSANFQRLAVDRK